jgi:hypothetical protein
MIWHEACGDTLCCACRCLVCGMGDGCHWKWVGGGEVIKEGGVDVRPLCGGR